MKISKIVYFIFVIWLALISSCTKGDHWGVKFKEDGSWWKQEGQSWDRKNKIFMTVGRSNPDWTDDFDMRRSADANARAEAAAFMNSFVKNYMKEVRSREYAISEGVVESSSKETLLGSVIVARRKYKNHYYSLLKMDMGYFFNSVYEDYIAFNKNRVRLAIKNMNEKELDEKIRCCLDEVKADLDAIGDTAARRAMDEIDKVGGQ